MIDRIVRSRLFYRLSEIAIPLLSWLIITVPIWLSPFHPALVAYFIIAFELYFLYKSITNAYYASLSFQRINQENRINYAKKLTKLKLAQTIKHFIIIPNYKEPIYKIESTINSFIRNDYPYKNIYLVLAFEKKEEDEAREKCAILEKKFSFFFNEIIDCYHTLVENEVQGKASNQTYAGKIIEKYAEENKLDPEKIIITVCDADSRLPKNYFSYLTHRYLQDQDRLYHFYWAPVLLYNNFWQLPFFVRIQATLSSVLRLSLLSNKENLIQISTYSTSLKLLQKINFWDVNIIPEDWHVYYQAFFALGEKVKTIPLYTIIGGDAVYSGTVIKTLTNRYEQEKRWAWGVSDVPYAINKLFTTPHINFLKKMRKVLFLIESHLLWPTSFFILTLSASIPPLINPIFKRTVLGFILPKLSGLILSFASSMLVLYVYLDLKLRQKVNQKTSYTQLPLLIVQWYLLPVVSFFLSSLPALDAHTRLLFGKKIKYQVTEKV